jgi:hypothetical protein
MFIRPAVGKPMSGGFTESDAEEAALGWLESLGYTLRHGPGIAFNVDGGERTDPGYRDTILQNRIAGAQAQVIDFDRPEQNDWLAVNQFTVIEGQQSRRADIVIFVNGLPLGVVELKNPADEGATVWDAAQQLENYQSLIPALFTYNAVLIASDGLQARIGALGAGKEWFKPWRTIRGREDAAPGLPELQVVLAGVFQPRRFSRSRPLFHCLRGSRRRRAREEDRGISPIPRSECRGRGDVAGRQSRARGGGGGRHLFRPPQPRRRTGRQASWRRLAHARLGQEPDDGLLCRAADIASGDGKPDHRRDHRPQRP